MSPPPLLGPETARTLALMAASIFASNSWSISDCVERALAILAEVDKHVDPQHKGYRDV